MAYRDRLKEVRLKRGLTQAQLAKQIGVAKSTYTGYETGNSEPNIFTLEKLMEALKIDANYLWQDDIKVTYEFKTTLTEQELIKMYRTISGYNATGKRVIDFIMNEEYQRCTSSLQNETIKEEPATYT